MPSNAKDPKMDFSLPVAKDNEVLIPIPYHCIERMFMRLSLAQEMLPNSMSILPGSATGRDIKMVRDICIKHLKNTNNFQDLGNSARSCIIGVHHKAIGRIPCPPATFLSKEKTNESH